jgi:putative transposase
MNWYGIISTIMSRAKRVTLGGYVYHVLNRANGRSRIFRKDGDFLAFERVLAEGIERFGMRLCGYCIMSNHWHLLLWPVNDGDLSDFMRWVTLTHTQRYHASHGTVGIGHLYQGRFKSFPVQNDGHYLTLMRYIEANPLYAGLVKHASDWRWSSLAVRRGVVKPPFELSNGPLELPNNWEKLVNEMAKSKHLGTLQNSLKRGTPFGDIEWQATTVKRMGLESTIRTRGRPKKCTGHL